MHHGVLITNAFLRTQKFVEHYEWLKKAAEQYGIALSLLENTDLLYVVGQTGKEELSPKLSGILSENDFVIYWDKDVAQGMVLEKLCKEQGICLFNSVSPVGVCDNKFETYRRLWEWNGQAVENEQIPLIPTIVAPMTYENIGYTNLDFVSEVIRQLGLPLVIKECFGSFGMQVYLAENEEEVLACTGSLAGKPFLYQKFIEASAGRDVRLQVVGDRVVAAMKRISKEGDFRANLTNGGSMKSYQPSKEECDLAVRTVKVLGLDFAGVDLLFGDGEHANIVCEVNSNAHFKNIHTCTGVNVAEEIIQYIRRKL